MGREKKVTFSLFPCSLFVFVSFQFFLYDLIMKAPLLRAELQL